MTQESEIQDALKELETIANLTLNKVTAITIDKAVKVLCARIAALEKKCSESFDAGWAACDQTHEDMATLMESEPEGQVH